MTTDERIAAYEARRTAPKPSPTGKGWLPADKFTALSKRRQKAARASVAHELSFPAPKGARAR